jgi:hypothetical protein
MQRNQDSKATLLLGLAFTVLVTLGGRASAQDATNVRPGFGYTIDFMTGATAESLLPAPRQEIIVVRPGFGYTIDFMTGPDAEALLPPGWAKQRALAKPPQS